MGRHRHRHGHDGHCVPVPGAVAPDAPSRAPPRPPARLRPRRDRRADRGDRRRARAAGRVPARAVPVRQRAGVEPVGALRRRRPRRARPPQPGDEPGHLRVDLRRGLRSAADRAHRARRPVVVRARQVHRALAVRLGVLRPRHDQRRGPPPARPPRAGRRRRSRPRGEGTVGPPRPARHRRGAAGPAGPGGHGHLPGRDGGGDDDDARAHEVPRSRDHEPVRGVAPHRRDVRASARSSGATPTAGGASRPSSRAA